VLISIFVHAESNTINDRIGKMIYNRSFLIKTFLVIHGTQGTDSNGKRLSISALLFIISC